MRFPVPHYNVEGCVAKRQDRITIDQLPMVGVSIFSDGRNKCRCHPVPGMLTGELGYCLQMH